MANSLDKFPAVLGESGINTQDSDFTAELELTGETKNMTSGIHQGLGPRFGMSPIPAHSNKDTQEILSSSSNLRGLRASEETGDELKYFVERRKFLGVIPIAIGSYDDLTLKGNMFLWLLTDKEDGTTESLSGVANCTWFDPSLGNNTYTYQFDMGYGFANNMWAQMDDATYTGLVGWLSPLISRVAAPNSGSLTAQEWTRQFLKFDESLYHVSSAVIAVSGNKWQQEWYYGKAITQGSASTAPTTNFLYRDTNTVYPMGISPSWNQRDYKKNNRDLTFWAIAGPGFQLMRKYVYSSYPVDETTFIEDFNQDLSTANYSLNGVASVEIPNDRGAAYNAGLVESCLMNDPEGFCDSSYRMVLIAGKKPYGLIMQDWQRDVEGKNVQIAPLTDRLHKPKTRTTNAFPFVGPVEYTENGVQKSTCFTNWPAFSAGTALASVPYTGTAPNWTNVTQHVMLGPANSGILRANTVYEFTYSVFDKQFGTETNVGEPAKFQTGSADFVALSLYRDARNGSGKWEQYLPAASGGGLPISEQNWLIFGSSTENPVWANYLDIRFYYRELGTYDWLPALFIPLTALLYYPDHQVLYACQGDVAGVPGGQPGGFNDYSFLPEDQYDCVVNYRGYAFWFSKTNAVYSLRNNPFAYPLRNSTIAPTGGFKGAIVHTYRGQSEQESRLIIFGGKETYIGKFTGQPLKMPVVVSPGNIAEFDLQGSDFNVETWTSITSFSYRSAVIADGDLFWWGPEGIFKDNGVSNPLRISQDLEPDLFDYYDQSLTDEIFAVYDDRAKEIHWFYPPVDDNTVTHVIIYDIESGQFFRNEFDCKIDWATRIATNNPTVTQKTNTTRTVLGVRENSSATIQRGVFYDYLNRAGDYAPTKELLVKAVASGSSSSQKVLTLDSGIDASILGTIVANDYITFQQVEKYTTSTANDFIAKVVSVDTAAKTITVNLPDGAVLPNLVSLAQKFCFPVWHAGANGLTQGLNGIPWTLETKYWGPKGPNYFGIWQWLYLFCKYKAWPKIDPAYLNIAYRTPSGGDYITDRSTFVDNSDSNFQLFHALRQGFLNNQGQAIKFKLSGIHIGEEWVLQYLELQGEGELGNVLKMYQG